MQVLSTRSPVDDGHRLTVSPSRKLWHIAGAAVLIAGKDDEMFMTKPQRYAKDNRTAHLTARSDKSVAYVTNNKRLLDVLYCWTLKQTTDRHEASRGLFATCLCLGTDISAAA